MPKLVSLIEQAQRQRAMAPTNPVSDIASIIMSSQAAMADVITRNFKGEIKDQVCAECASITSTLENALRAFVKAEIAALPVPERVIVERTVETVTERVDAEKDEDEMEAITVQRKDGIISTVKKGDLTYDVIRNKSGLIKEVRPRG